MWILLTALALAQDVAPAEKDIDESVDEPVEETVVEDQVEPEQPPNNATFVWQGFDHTWLRRVLGLFAVPHRVSLFRSRPQDEVHEPTGDGVQSQVRWQFGQSTGVDGDLMTPLAYISRVYAPGVEMHQGRLTFDTVDRIADRRSPRALARFNDMLLIPVSSEHGGHAQALVRGLAFRSACMDQPDQCNSDGIWPYRFRVELAPCMQVDGTWACPVTVEVGRAWTPGRGGVKGIEEKPLNERMAIEVELDWVVMEGTPDALASSTFVFENALGSNRKIHEAEQALPIPVEGGGAFPAATVGLSSFGFEFFPRKGRRKDVHRGRYVAGWNLRVHDRYYDADDGVFVIGHEGSIWLPRTVNRTGVGIELGISVVQFGDPGATVVAVDPIEGRLCSDSHGAPFFSTWTKCEKRSGTEQLEQDVDVRVDP